MQLWMDLLSIAESISFTDDSDAIIWAFDGSSSFSVQTVYKTISFRGVQPVFTPSIWNICVPPLSIPFFGFSQTTKLWLEWT